MHSHACLHKDQKKKREGRITGGVNTSISPTPRTKLDLSECQQQRHRSSRNTTESEERATHMPSVQVPPGLLQPWARGAKAVERTPVSLALQGMQSGQASPDTDALTELTNNANTPKE